MMMTISVVVRGENLADCGHNSSINTEDSRLPSC